MTDIRFFSWNTQGDFTSTAKTDVIDSFGASGQPTVVFVQEGGVNKGGQRGGWVAYSGQGVGAKNERCTNYVLLNEAAAKSAVCNSVTLQDGQNRAVVGGGEAGRTPAAVGWGRNLLASWHSMAGRCNEDTTILMQAFEANREYQNYFDTIIIGADFNTSAGDLNAVVFRDFENSRRLSKLTYVHRYVVACGKNTFKKGGELDYFVVLSKHDLKSPACETKSVDPSDHNPIAMPLSL